MSEPVPCSPLVRSTGEQRWFYGGGIHTWLATAADTGGTFLLFEDSMECGKMTPLHTHPADETMYLLAGEILLQMDGTQSRVKAGGVVIAPHGVPHAFQVLVEGTRMLCLHTPASAQEFYLGASIPLGELAGGGQVVDFARVQASAREHGGIELLGPPPFGPL